MTSLGTLSFRIVLVTPRHTAIGSRVPGEHLPPLGLLAVGGPLIDAGHRVSLINADKDDLTDTQTVERILEAKPDMVLFGHSGSTSAHPTIVTLSKLVRAACADVKILYGGVFPTYHWREVLTDCPWIDLIVKGEGERTTVEAVNALGANQPLNAVPGIAFHGSDGPQATQPAQMITDLDAVRTGWELINFEDYGYWGGKRSVVMQFSRGCPHLCTYCGQRGFWTRWRHRDPQAFADEIAWLVREHGVELVNLADENPTSSPKAWEAFLDALIAHDVDVLIVGSTRADDIVRDEKILWKYKKAGVIRFLLGLEGTDEGTLATLKKGGTRNKDRHAIQVLRAHGMIGLCTFAVGFEEESDADYWRLLRTLMAYDPDQVMSVYATPHRWTPFYADSRKRTVIETDLRYWDYKHQVLDCPKVPPWRVFVWVKLIELSLQLRPKALWRTYAHPTPEIRHAMRWYTRMGRGVVMHELKDILVRLRRKGGTVEAFWGGSECLPENAMSRQRPNRLSKPRSESHRDAKV